MTIIIFNIITMIIVALIIITIKGVGERPEITPSDDEFKPVQRDVSGLGKKQNWTHYNSKQGTSVIDILTLLSVPDTCTDTFFTKFKLIVYE